MIWHLCSGRDTLSDPRGESILNRLSLPQWLTHERGASESGTVTALRDFLVLVANGELWRAKGSKCCHCGSVAQWRLTLCDPMACSTLEFPILHCLLEFAQIHIHWVGDAIQPSYLLLPPSPPALNLSRHQSLSQWVGSSHQVPKYRS